MIQYLQENMWAKAATAVVSCSLVSGYAASMALIMRLHVKDQQPMPWTIFEYWYQYSHLAYVMDAIKLCGLGGLLMAGALLFAIFKPKKRSLHGDAKFANWSDIKKANLTGDWGIIMGKFKDCFLLLPGVLGLLLAAPPRSGKGNGPVMGNLLAFPDSTVALDVRQEAFKVTSGFRSTFSQVHLFNPFDGEGKTAQYNPLSYVRDDAMLRVADLQKIANFLSPQPETGDPFWPAACRTLFLGVALYLFETPGMPRTFGEITRQVMTCDEATPGEKWANIIETRQSSDRPLSNACRSALEDFVKTNATTQQSIRKTFTAKLELWLDPLVDRATSADSFDLRRLRRDKMSIYVGVNPGELDRGKLLLNLFFQQTMDQNMDEMPTFDKTIKYQLMLMMDEFTSIGKMNIFTKAVSLMGGYNIRPVVIIQNQSQLRSVYGNDDAKTITQCLAAHINFAPNDSETAEDISKTLGDTTVKVRNKTFEPFWGKRGNVTETEQARRLLKPQEVREIGAEKQIIIMENCRPILCKKVRYYKEPVFQKRLLPPVPVAALPAWDLTVIRKVRKDEPTKAVQRLKKDLTRDMLQQPDFDLKKIVGYETLKPFPKDQPTPQNIDDLVKDLANMCFVSVSAPAANQETTQEANTMALMA